jgi:site-specific DNA recombinase
MSRRFRTEVAANPNAIKKALIYSRVSTEEQAQNAHSMIEQERLLRDYCEQNGLVVVGHHSDAGFSASSLKRPGFQAMLDRAFDSAARIDCMVVHSLSRAFRSLVDQEGVITRLRAAGVRFISIRDNITDDADGFATRALMGLTNQLKSVEASRDTMRGMAANARAGYQNGGRIPLGYRSLDAGRVGNKMKKRLEIDPVEAEIVRLAFKLADEGDGQSGPLGVKRIATYINAAGYRSRSGNTFGTGTVHEMLVREAYKGSKPWNMFNRNGSYNNDSDIIDVNVPAIIDPAQFDRVQAKLASRVPAMRGPRLEAAPSLFGGLIHCAHCEGAMSPATGTSRNGTIYTYYKCLNVTKKGTAVCKGLRVSRPKTEHAVMNALLEQLINPTRISTMLHTLRARRAARNVSAESRIAALQTEAQSAIAALSNIYNAIEKGLVDTSEPTLKGSIQELVEKRDQTVRARDRAMATIGGELTIDPARVEAFSQELRIALTSGETAARKLWLKSIVDRIIVYDDKIQIIGRNDNFERGLKSSVSGSPPVRISIQEWCPEPDLNQRHADFQSAALPTELSGHNQR